MKIEFVKKILTRLNVTDINANFFRRIVNAQKYLSLFTPSMSHFDKPKIFLEIEASIAN
jgi:hypothetical protein